MWLQARRPHVPHALLAEEVARRCAFVLVVALVGAGCSGQSSSHRSAPVVAFDRADGPSVRQLPTQPAPPTPHVSPEIAWRTDLAAAQVDAERAGRGVLICFRADWSASSAQLARTLWSNDEVRQAVRAIVPIDVDVTDVDDPTNEAASARFEVHRVPTLIVLDRRGAEVARFDDVPNADALLDALDRAAR